MFLKIITITLFAYFATSTCEENEPEVASARKSELTLNSLVATWPTNISDGYFEIPLTVEAAKSEGWTEIEGAHLSPDVVALGFKGDPRFVVFYSIWTRQAIGYQIGFEVEDVAGVPINYDNHLGITRKPLNGRDYYTGSVYFSKNENGVDQIWLEYNATSFLKIPIHNDLVTSETPYLKKNCIATMANPHYYVMNSTSDCSTFYPWFLIGDNENIVGIGFQAYGNATASPDRTWWEYIPLAGVLLAISDTPQCLTDYVNDYNIISIHTWFIKDPSSISCNDA